MDDYLFPKEMRCPKCNALLILSKDERLSGSVNCPECEKVIQHSEFPEPIDKNSIYCPLCRQDYSISKNTCPHCGANNTFEESVEEHIDNNVVVTDIRMSFGSMVRFMVKWAIAAIPAAIILFLIASILWAVFGALLLSMAY